MHVAWSAGADCDIGQKNSRKMLKNNSGLLWAVKSFIRRWDCNRSNLKKHSNLSKVIKMGWTDFVRKHFEISSYGKLDGVLSWWDANYGWTFMEIRNYKALKIRIEKSCLGILWAGECMMSPSSCSSRTGLFFFWVYQFSDFVKWHKCAG